MSYLSPFVIVSHVVSHAVTEGFIPAVQQLGYPVVLLTDQKREHSRVLSGEVSVIECDVFNPMAILDTLTDKGICPVAIFSNSDHLQTATAIVAKTLGLPGKDWKICYAAKQKWQMRQRLATLNLPSVWSRQLLPGSLPDASWPWPLVVKPVQGVASMNVRLAENPQQLAGIVKSYDSRQTLLLEQFIEGPLFTLETLGDGDSLIAVGGFDVELSEPPHFVETGARWEGEYACRWRQQALSQLREFGVKFGVCHSEFIATPSGPVLVEINYRSIGDGREFLLDSILPSGWFTPILQIYLGKPAPTVLPSSASAVIHYVVAEKEGILQQLPAPSPAPGVCWRPLKQAGDTVRLTHSNKDYLGVLCLQADSR